MQATESCGETRGFGVFEVDLRSGELRKRGVRIKLQEQPFQILSLLLERPGELVTREELRQKLWPAHTFVDFDRSLNKAMTKLRFAIGDSAESPHYVETIPRHGYRFLAPVSTPREGTGAVTFPAGNQAHEIAGVHAKLPEQRGRTPSALESLNLQTRAGRKRVSALAAAIGAAILSVFVYMRIHQPVVLGGSSGVVSPRRSVAVLSFKNLSGDAQEAWLSTALSDWLTTELTAGEQVRAIPAESIARMRIELALPDVESLGHDSLTRIRKNLGTDYVVAGSYAALGSMSEGQIRLDLHLQDTRSGETVAAISESGTEAHLLDLVSRAGEHLREKLGIRAVTSEEAAEVAIALPSNPQTTKLFSEGLAKLRVFDTLAARNLLLKAVAAEPEYALSHAALASAWEQLGYDEKAQAEAKKAYDLSSNLSRAERLLVEARYRETSRDWGKAIEIYRALFDFFPDNLDYGLALTNSQLRSNRWKDALATIEALRALPAPLRDDPRIDLAENDATRSLGDMRRAEAALARAAEKAHAAGASLLLAKARREQAWLFENSGKQAEVEGAISEAKQLYIAANDRLGVAATATLEAIALERQGDYLGARNKYEESLGIYRESGNKASLSSEYDNLGDVLFYLGDLAGARKSFEAALATYDEIGDQNGVALAQIGLGDVLLALGKHNEAKAMYESSLEICRQLGSRGRQAAALEGVANAHRMEGDIEGAQKRYKDAISILEEIGDKNEEAHIRLHLAELLLDEGKSGEAESIARQSANVFGETRAGRYQVEANLLMSNALAAQGRNAEAGKNIDQVMKIAIDSHNRRLELKAAITAARIQAASASATEAAESVKRLHKIISDAGEASFADVVLDARLAVGEIELNSGNRVDGSALLEALEKDAKNGGFQLIAQKAAAALRSKQDRAALQVHNR
jgi:DNA-binding winged helix-turn-helix (wHTH) protein/tetratricopeptide (TPR) repeat protein